MLNPVLLTLARVGYVRMLVIPGTMLRGWNTAYLTPNDAKFLFENFESSLGLAAAEGVEADDEDWQDEGVLRVYELPEPVADLVELLFFFDDGANVAYVNPGDDPMFVEGGE
jgi:hypothetical protein